MAPVEMIIHGDASDAGLSSLKTVLPVCQCKCKWHFNARGLPDTMLLLFPKAIIFEVALNVMMINAVTMWKTKQIKIQEGIEPNN